jgi:hypothetical protein
MEGECIQESNRNYHQRDLQKLYLILQVYAIHLFWYVLFLFSRVFNLTTPGNILQALTGADIGTEVFRTVDGGDGERS